MIAFADDVKKAFSKAKEDALELKRAVNSNVSSIEGLAKRIDSVTGKDEFYAFVRRLGARLDQIESSISGLSALSIDIESLSAKLGNVEKKFSRQEDLSSEIKEIRKLNGKLAAVEGKSVGIVKFNEGLGSLAGQVQLLRKEFITGKELKAYSEKVSDAMKRLAKDEGEFAYKNDAEAALAAIREFRDELGSFREKLGKKTADSVRKIEQSVELLGSSAVEKGFFEEKLGELRRDVRSVKDLIDNSVSEVNLGDYVTKKELVKKLSSFDYLSADSLKLHDGLSAISKELAKVKGGTASLQDVDRISRDVKEVSKAIDALKSGIERLADATQRNFDNSLKAMQARHEKEFSSLREKLDSEVSKVKAGLKEKRSSPSEGVLSRVGKGVAEFFREEEEPEEVVAEVKKEAKKTAPQEKKKTGLWLFMILAIVVVIVIGGGVLYFMQAGREKPAAVEETKPGIIEIGGDPVTEAAPVQEVAENETPAEVAASATGQINSTEGCIDAYECKERSPGEYWFDCSFDEKVSECRCFVTNAEGCGIVKEEPVSIAAEAEKKGINKGLYGAVVAVVVLLLFVYLRRMFSKKDKKPERKAEEKKAEKAARGSKDDDGVDLEEFFEKKENDKGK